MCVKPKYNIRRFLLKMPGTYRHNCYLLCIAIGITEKTLSRWLKIEATDKFSIKTDQLYKIAEFFNCKPDDLNTPANVKQSI